MRTTADELDEAGKWAAVAAIALTRAAAALASPGDDTPTDEQINQAARIRLACTDALDVLHHAGLGAPDA